MKLFCVDPSIRALGWCLIDVLDRGGVLTACGVQKRREGDWFERAREMAAFVWATMDECTSGGEGEEGGVLLIEMPQVFGSGGAGAASAARDSGDLLKLAVCVGMLAEVGDGLGWNVELVPVSVWKGQTPKTVTQMRVRRFWSMGERDEGDHNMMDAIGIGTWYMKREGVKAVPVRMGVL